MTEVTVKQSFGQVEDNPVGLGQEVTVPVIEGLNITLASFQALYL
ncbi:MAG TPA: DNA starvation/stationary phase protection protein, partial [Cyanobacteria bacterium UBA11368]|nr:DNA starvation/stationary phase protection protein [Cyanobacteria bacterium UBA11368]